MNKLDLLKAEERLNNRNITGEQISSLIKRAANDNDKTEFFEWIIGNEYFRNFQYVLNGINQSNKWSLIKTKIAEDCIHLKQPYWYAYCFALTKSPIPKDSFLKFKLTLEELCLLSGFSESKEFGFPSHPILILYHGKYAKEFNLNVSNIVLPFHLKIQKTPTEELLKISFGEELNINNISIFAYKNDILAELNERYMDATGFQKFLIQSTLVYYKKSNLKGFKLIDKKWPNLMFETTKQVLESHYKSDKNRRIRGKLYKWVREDDANLINIAYESYVNGVICFRLLQARLHFNLELQLTYNEIKKFKPLESYIMGLCQIGVLNPIDLSVKFKWPELKELSSDTSYMLEDIYNSFNQDSPLSKLSYHVGKTGEEKEFRRRQLSLFFEGKSRIEDQLTKLWETDWGEPNSALRLEKIVYHIYRQATLNQSKKAIEDWKSDLQFLKKRYYEPNKEMNLVFKYPDGL